MEEKAGDDKRRKEGRPGANGDISYIMKGLINRILYDHQRNSRLIYIKHLCVFQDLILV